MEESSKKLVSGKHALNVITRKKGRGTQDSKSKKKTTRIQEGHCEETPEEKREKDTPGQFLGTHRPKWAKGRHWEGKGERMTADDVGSGIKSASNNNRTN